MLHTSARHQFPSTNNKYQMNKSLRSALSFSVCNKAIIRDFPFSISFHSMISICRKGSIVPLMMPYTRYKTIVPMIRLAIGAIGSGVWMFRKVQKEFSFSNPFARYWQEIEWKSFYKGNYLCNLFCLFKLARDKIVCVYVFAETLHVLKSHSVTALISHCFEDPAQKRNTFVR